MIGFNSKTKPPPIQCARIRKKNEEKKHANVENCIKLLVASCLRYLNLECFKVFNS